MDKKAVILEHLKKQIKPLSASWIAKDLKGIGYKTARAFLVELWKAGTIKRTMIAATSSQYGYIHRNAFWFIERTCEECKAVPASHTIYHVPVPAPDYWAARWLCPYCHGMIHPDYGVSITISGKPEYQATRDYWKNKRDEAIIQKAIDANTDQYT